MATRYMRKKCVARGARISAQPAQHAVECGSVVKGLALYDDQQLDLRVLHVAEVIIVVVIVVNNVEIVGVEPHRRPGFGIREPIAAVLEPVRIMAPVDVEMVVASEVAVVSAIGDYAAAMTRMDVSRVIGRAGRLRALVILLSRAFLARILLLVSLVLLPRSVVLLLLSDVGFLLRLLLLLSLRCTLLFLALPLLGALLFLALFLCCALLLLLLPLCGPLLLLALPLLGALLLLLLPGLVTLLLLCLPLLVSRLLLFLLRSLILLLGPLVLLLLREDGCADHESQNDCACEQFHL